MPIRAGVVYAIRARTRAEITRTRIVRPGHTERAAGRWKAHAGVVVQSMLWMAGGLNLVMALFVFLIVWVRLA
jgi:hypothetical protein